MEVDSQGKVAEVKTVGECPELYQEAIRAALLQWRFRPGTIDEKPVAFPMPVKITFTNGKNRAPSAPQQQAAKDGISFIPNAVIVRSIFPDLHAELEAQSRQGKKFKMARPLNLTKPKYPDRRKAGHIWSAFIVNEKGRTQNLHLLGDVPKEFQDSLASAVASWEFEPAKVDGKPVASPIAVKFSFVLRK
jgi:hypothetical protein